MITSTANPQVKNLQQLMKKSSVRSAQDVFLVEGMKMFLEAPRERIQKIYVSKSLYEEKGQAFFDGVSMEILDDRVYAAVSDTKTPQGILCLLKQYHYTLEDLTKKRHPFLLILENLQDPGSQNGGRSRGRWNYSEQGFCGHLQSEDYPCYNGGSLSYAIFLCRRFKGISSGT